MDKSFYVYNKNIFNDDFFQKNISFHLSRLNINNVNLYHELHLNNMGCLDKHLYQLNKDKKRVIFIGDSFTSGMDCSFSWFELLKKKFHDIDFFNFGMPGAGPSNWIKKLSCIQSLKPDIVFINMVDNILFRPEITFFSDDKEEFIFCKYHGFDNIYCKALIDKNVKFHMNANELKILHNKFINKINKKKNSPNIIKNFNSKIFHQNNEYVKLLLNITNQNIILKFPSFSLFNNIQELNNHNQAINNLKNPFTSIFDLRSEMNQFKKEDLYMDFHWNLLGNHIAAKYIYKILTNYLQDNIQ